MSANTYVGRNSVCACYISLIGVLINVLLLTKRKIQNIFCVYHCLKGIRIGKVLHHKYS